MQSYLCPLFIASLLRTRSFQSKSSSQGLLHAIWDGNWYGRSLRVDLPALCPLLRDEPVRLVAMLLVIHPQLQQPVGVSFFASCCDVIAVATAVMMFRALSSSFVCALLKSTFFGQCTHFRTTPNSTVLWLTMIMRDGSCQSQEEREFQSCSIAHSTQKVVSSLGVLDDLHICRLSLRSYELISLTSINYVHYFLPSVVPSFSTCRKSRHAAEVDRETCQSVEN